MKNHTKKHWTLRRKLITGILVVLGGLVGLIVVWAGLVIFIVASAFMTRAYITASDASQLSEREKNMILGSMRITDIPDSATEIYMYKQGGKDTMLFCSLTLAPEDIPKFVEEFAGVPLSEFKDGHTSRHHTITRGRPRGMRWKPHYWNITDIKRGKYYEVGVAAGRFIVIDLDTNRVYLARWDS